MNCIIVEDEPAAQSLLEHNISLCHDLRCIGTFSNAFAAQVFLTSNETDLIFLDINLPEMSGVSFMRTLVNPPLIIFTTAYPQYAVDAFDLEVVDFLLKPFSFERFCKAVNKARESNHSKRTASISKKISIKCDRRIYQVGVEDILFIETCGDYVYVHLIDKKLLVHGTLKSWEEKLKGSTFLKVHRTAIVNLSKIDHIEGNLIITGSHKIPLSEPYKPDLFERLFNDR